MGRAARPANLAVFVGAMLAGTQGAIVAFVGVVAPGAFAILLVASAYVSLAGASASPVFKGAFQGLAAGAVGVMVSTVAQTAKTAVRARGAEQTLGLSDESGRERKQNLEV